MLEAVVDDFEILLRTPFSRLHFRAPASSRSYAGALLLQRRGPLTLPWGIDIWLSGHKVMNLEWGDAGRVDLVSFRGGDWEQRLLLHVAEDREE
jgi:hypothetical protein